MQVVQAFEAQRRECLNACRKHVCALAHPCRGNIHVDDGGLIQVFYSFFFYGASLTLSVIGGTTVRFAAWIAACDVQQPKRAMRWYCAPGEVFAYSVHRDQWRSINGRNKLIKNQSWQSNGSGFKTVAGDCRGPTRSTEKALQGLFRVVWSCWYGVRKINVDLIVRLNYLMFFPRSIIHPPWALRLD